MKTLLGVLVFVVLVGCETVPKQVLPYVIRDRPGSSSLDLHLYDLEAGGSRPLRQTPHDDECDPAVDPMGQRVAYIVKTRDRQAADGSQALRVMDLVTGQVVEQQAYRLPMFSPSWSNNGKRIAYVVERDGKLQIEVKKVGTTEKPTLIGFGSEPSWRVDDGAIFYNSRDTHDAAAGELMVHDLATGLNQTLSLRGNGFANLARGTSVVYTTLPYSRRNEAVWIIDVNSRQKRLSNPGKTHRDTDPVHINGGKFVAFTRTDVKTGKSAIYVVERYADDPVEAPLFDAQGDVFTGRP